MQDFWKRSYFSLVVASIQMILQFLLKVAQHSWIYQIVICIIVEVVIIVAHFCSHLLREVNSKKYIYSHA